MKVVLFNGSYKPNGNTFRALSEIAKTLNDEGIETEICHIGGKPIRDCIACGACQKIKKCIFDDDVANEWLKKAKEADGVIFGTPVYYAHASGRLQSVMDRMFYSSGGALSHKIGACVAVARRAGAVSALDDIEKHMTISNMIVVGSSYWNVAFGREPGECEQDLEGMQTMRNLARNMAWLLKCVDLGKQNNINPPLVEYGNRFNFIR